MLVELSIRNIALIEKLRVLLEPGFNVLTGETGAGKSIVVDALNLALGDRADRELIRTGAERGSVEALFDISKNEEAKRLLAEIGAEAESDLVAVSREITSQGRSVSRVGGSVVPLGKLRQLTRLLVDVHGQHEHQQLCDPGNHMGFLDAYGDEAHALLIRAVEKDYAAYARARRAAEALRMDGQERERRRDMLAFQLEEIDSVKPKPGEDEKLQKKDALLRNAEKIAGGLERAYVCVYAGGGRSLSAQESLKRAAEAMAGISPLDDRFEAIRAKLEELFYLAQDAGDEIQSLREGLEYNPGEAEKIAARLSEIRRLEKKYGPELKDVLDFAARAREELEELNGGDEKICALEKERDEYKKALDADAKLLTERRRALSRELTRRITKELGELGMARTRFETRFTPCECGPRGADKIEFLISPNPGEPLKPLGAIASGGELSRIMLAMKAIAADQGGVDSMVFDEIDTGVSGRMAQVVGEKMASIAGRRQVICVTHLPQIAALADAHFLVEKTVQENRTGSSVYRLDEQGRVAELARMVGGAGDSASGLSHAANMLSAARALVAEKYRAK